MREGHTDRLPCVARVPAPRPSRSASSPCAGPGHGGGSRGSRGSGAERGGRAALRALRAEERPVLARVHRPARPRVPPAAPPAGAARGAPVPPGPHVCSGWRLPHGPGAAGTAALPQGRLSGRVSRAVFIDLVTFAPAWLLNSVWFSFPGCRTPFPGSPGCGAAVRLRVRRSVHGAAARHHHLLGKSGAHAHTEEGGKRLR